MIAVNSDPGEELFKRYLAANNYDMLAYESGLGTMKRPEFLIRAAGHKVVVEVESFKTPPMSSDPQSGFVSTVPAVWATVQGDRPDGGE
jgi:hypothetical protein